MASPLGRIKFDVVEGDLPFLLGRDFLRVKGGVLDFKQNFMKIGGQVFPNACQIPLSFLAKHGECSKNRADAAATGTTHPANSLEVHESRDSQTVVPDDGDSSKYRADATRVHERPNDRPRGGTEASRMDGEKQISEHNCKREKWFTSAFDGCVCDFNVFTALQEIERSENPDRQIEDAVLREWLGPKNAQQTEANQVAIPQASQEAAEKLPALRDRSGYQTLIPADVANELFRKWKTPIWYIRAGFIRRLHFLRHAPAAKMYSFIVNAIPISARQQIGSHPAIKIFIENVKRFCESVVQKCTGCLLNTKAISRPIGLSVVAAFYLGLIDCFCLDYSQKWYALVICDVGSGGTWAFVIRDAYPPTAQGVYVTYITRYAANWGPHKQILADSDSIFKGTEALSLWAELGVERNTTAAFAHSSLGGAERRIGMYRWSIDRIRDSGQKPLTLQGWEVTLAQISNCFFNEPDASGTTPSMRLTGQNTSLLRNALTDNYVTSNVGTNTFLEQAEKAREVYTFAKTDRKLRNMLNSNLPKGAESEPAFPTGTKVAFYEERTGARDATRRGPATVLAQDDAGNYVLNFNGQVKIADRLHCRVWIDAQNEERADPVVQRLESGEQLQQKLSGTHPADIIENADSGPDLHIQQPDLATPDPGDPTFNGPDHGPLIHDPELAAARDAAHPITCGRCLGRNQKHAHKRGPGCRLWHAEQDKLAAQAQNRGGGDRTVPTFSSLQEAEEFIRRMQLDNNMQNVNSIRNKTRRKGLRNKNVQSISRKVRVSYYTSKRRERQR